MSIQEKLRFDSLAATVAKSLIRLQDQEQFPFIKLLHIIFAIASMLPICLV